MIVLVDRDDAQMGGLFSRVRDEVKRTYDRVEDQVKRSSALTASIAPVAGALLAPFTGGASLLVGSIVGSTAKVIAARYEAGKAEDAQKAALAVKEQAAMEALEAAREKEAAQLRMQEATDKFYEELSASMKLQADLARGASPGGVSGVPTWVVPVAGGALAAVALVGGAALYRRQRG